MEIFYLPLLNKKYIDRFITIENDECAREAMRSNKGNVILGIHEGSWEIATSLFACLFSNQKLLILTRTPKNLARLYGLLDSYRTKNGFTVINTDEGMRSIVQYLKKGYTLFIAIDHGVEGGMEIDFFGRKTLVPIGALKLALRLDLNIFIGTIVRKRGPYHTGSIIAYTQVKTGNDEEDLKINLKNIHQCYEQFLTRHPEEYHWFYKKWKYSSQRTVLVLSDGKPGHLKQSLAVVDTMKKLHFEIVEDVAEVQEMPAPKKAFFHFCGIFFGRTCQGCLWCLKQSLGEAAVKKLNARAYDFVVSCGSSLASINRLLAFENLAKSIVIMRPGIFSFKRFDLVVMPRHDRFPRAKNVVPIEGALTRDPAVYAQDINAIISRYCLEDKALAHPVIGFVIGGENKTMAFGEGQIERLARSLKASLEKLSATVLVTTSRRTSRPVEEIIKREFQRLPHCRMLVIANEDNPRGAFEAILKLADILVVSGDSISMVSEAIHYGKPVVVFKLEKKTSKVSKHEIFLHHLEGEGLVRTVDADTLAVTLEEVWREKPRPKKILDQELLLQRLRQLF